jgi:probable rRNA maturation factor
MSLSVEVQIEGPFADKVSQEWLSSVAQTALDMENRSAGSLTLVITDDETVRGLNRDYLGIDAPTDVLAFGGESPDFVSAPEAADYLGDVLISYPQAQRQVDAAGHSVEAELTLLVIHGVLHLLGYDHVSADEKDAMWQRQGRILSHLGLGHIQPV